MSCAGAFLVAGIVAAAVRAVVTLPHGWWLVAYLVLVGAVAQALLGAGEVKLAARDDPKPPPATMVVWQLALWNTGTVAVALADLAGAPAGVLAGSVALLVALALFARGPGQRLRAARRRPLVVEALYLLLVASLVVSVLTGCYLAYALPGQ